MGNTKIFPNTFAILGHPNIGFAAIAILGLLGFIFHHTIIGWASRYFLKLKKDIRYISLSEGCTKICHFTKLQLYLERKINGRYMIRLVELKKAYQQVMVLDVDHLEIDQGETVGLVGNNGAGKTTMLSLILDLIRPSSGDAFIKDSNVRTSEEWKRFTTAFLDESFLIDFLTPDEYFEFVGSLYHWSPSRVAEFIGIYAEFFNDEIIGKKKYIRDL